MGAKPPQPDRRPPARRERGSGHLHPADGYEPSCARNAAPGRTLGAGTPNSPSADWGHTGTEP
eukprot:9123018-Alexandrium_andersonii.AAC.1